MVFQNYFLDAWFLTSSGAKTETLTSDDLRLIYPNSSGAINKQQIIVDEDDVWALRKEMLDIELREKLVKSHELSRRVFVDSQVAVHKIVALQIVIKKLPYQW